jgi:hypothetical protein
MERKPLLAVFVGLAAIGIAAADDGGTGHAAPQSVTVTCGTNSAAVSWNAVQDPMLSGYDVYEQVTGDPQFTKANANLITGTQYTVTGLAASTSYTFGVKAVYSDGIHSSMSGTATCTTG